jgi:hypothetical protein
VQALVDLLHAVADALAHRLLAEFQPFDQDRLLVAHARPAVDADHVEVDPE